MSNKIVTDDCIQSFITKHYGKTSISGIGDGTVTGAISTLNSNMKGEWFAPKPTSGYLIEGCGVKFGKLVICNFSLKLQATNTSITPQHNWRYATGFPESADFIEVAGVHYRMSGAESKSPILSCTFSGDTLVAYYPNDEYLTNSSGVNFTFAYRCK